MKITHTLLLTYWYENLSMISLQVDILSIEGFVLSFIVFAPSGRGTKFEYMRYNVEYDDSKDILDENMVVVNHVSGFWEDFSFPSPFSMHAYNISIKSNKRFVQACNRSFNNNIECKEWLLTWLKQKENKTLNVHLGGWRVTISKQTLNIKQHFLMGELKHLWKHGAK